MLDELHAASTLLKVAVDRYLDACLAVAKSHRPGGGFHGFSEIIMNELEELDSYERKVTHGKRTLGKIRNRRVDIVPVNTLPSELLARIFLLASPPESCFIRDEDPHLKYPSSTPESLLQVCSYWRSVALETHSLWTHTDLAPHHMYDRGYLTRATLFASQAGQLPLNLHIDLRRLSRDLPLEADWSETCISLARRAKCLAIILPCPVRAEALLIVAKALDSSVPGQLVQFAMMDFQGPCSQGFLIAQGSERSHDGGSHEDAETIEEDGASETGEATNIGDNVSDDINTDEGSDTESSVDEYHLDVQRRHLEELLLGVTILRLDALYLPWSSQAYHGLVKLHLSGEIRNLITISQLEGILQASPQLAFFRFSTTITIDRPPQPVQLNCLEVLHLELDSFEAHENALRLIVPGPKPLRVITHLWCGGKQLLLEGEYRRFFGSSNVTQLDIWVRGWGSSLHLFDLLDLVPQLETLSLHGFRVALGSKSTYPSDTERFPAYFRLAKLYLATSYIDPKVMEWVNEVYPAMEMIVNSQIICAEVEEDDKNSTTRWGELEWQGEELANKYPAVTCVRRMRFPGEGENWNY